MCIGRPPALIPKNMDEQLLKAYSDIIIDHSQFPRCHGELDKPTHKAQGENPFCGDRISLQISVDEHHVISEVAFEATGCAISTASASLMASHLQGLSLAQAEALFAEIRQLILSGPSAEPREELGELAALSFAGHYPSRVKCATLAWHVLKHALAGDESVASTE
jgi:nitrogen fixation NifU-like protein